MLQTGVKVPGNRLALQIHACLHKHLCINAVLPSHLGGGTRGAERRMTEQCPSYSYHLGKLPEVHMSGKDVWG